MIINLIEQIHLHCSFENASLQVHWEGYRRHHARQSTGALAQQQPVGRMLYTHIHAHAAPLTRLSYVAHSQYAVQLVLEMRIGQGQVVAADHVEMGVVGEGDPFRVHAARSSLPSAPPLSSSSGDSCARACVFVAPHLLHSYPSSFSC